MAYTNDLKAIRKRDEPGTSILLSMVDELIVEFVRNHYAQGWSQKDVTHYIQILWDMAKDNKG